MCELFSCLKNRSIAPAGYVYDTESGLYYLQSRYYSPEVGRFINADALITTGQGLLGNNMFAYCRNSPVCLIDPDGDCPHDGKFYTSGVFEGQFEYNPNCTLCAMHGEFILIGPSGVLIDMTTFDLTEDQKVLIATMAAEATVTAQGEYVSPQARQAMANVALNRVGKREWAKYKTVADICAYTGFDGYGSRDYYACMHYLNNRDGSNAVYEEIIWDTMKAYEWDITDGCQLYYTPATMYSPGREPSWNFGLLQEVIIPGVDSYYEGRFFRYR